MIKNTIILGHHQRKIDDTKPQAKAEPTDIPFSYIDNCQVEIIREILEPFTTLR